jgi:hypothetical protein
MVLTPQPKRTVPVHHKKRIGQHQPHTKRFKDTYWPYLPLLIIVVLGIGVGMVWSRQQHQVLGATNTIQSATLLQATNAQRSNHHEQALATDAQLNAAAQAKANDMVAHNYWSHTSPSGVTPWTFISNAGYRYQAAGENLAYGFSNSNDVTTGWMNSAEHRDNILDNAYSQVGFGIASSSNFQGHGTETIVVALYAEPATGATSNPHVLGASTGSSQHIARIQLLTGGVAPWSVAVVVGVSAICIVAFAIRHGLLWRRALARSEAFVIKHPFLDVAIVSIAVMGVLLSRVGGVIL